MEPNEIDSRLDRANQLLEEGKPKDALECLEPLSDAPLDADDQIEFAALRAWALSDLGDHETAIAQLERALEEHPESVRLLGTLGIVLLNNSELDDARELLERAVELAPEDDVAVANLALVYERMREYRHALELFDRALELGAEVDWVLMRRAQVLAECGEYEEAKRTLRRYLSLAPQDGAQWISLGILHSDDDEYEAAYECYREAESIAAEDSSLRLNWGVTAVRARDLKEARRQLGLLGKIEPRSTRWWLLRAFILEEDGRPGEARTIYDRVLKDAQFKDRGELTYALEMAMDFYARQKLRPRCLRLVERAYLVNACTVELCEAYREASGRYVKKAFWYSIVVEANYRPGLEEVRERGADPNARMTRFAREYQVVARNHDEAVGIVIDFARRMGERNPSVREFVGEEQIEDTFTGIYEVEPESFVFAGDADDSHADDDGGPADDGGPSDNGGPSDGEHRDDA